MVSDQYHVWPLRKGVNQGVLSGSGSARGGYTIGILEGGKEVGKNFPYPSIFGQYFQVRHAHHWYTFSPTLLYRSRYQVSFLVASLPSTITYLATVAADSGIPVRTRHTVCRQQMLSWFCEMGLSFHNAL